MLLWLPLAQLASQPTITAVALCQQGWTSLLHTKTESLCAHIGGDSLSIYQYAGKRNVTSNTHTSDITHILLSNTHTLHPVHILVTQFIKRHTQFTELHTQYTYFIPSTHTSSLADIRHTQYTYFIPSTHTLSLADILHTQ